MHLATDIQWAPPSVPASYAVVAASGRARAVGAPPEAFVLRVPSLEWWDRLSGRSAYAVASAFVAGDFQVDGDLVAAIRWWRAGRPPHSESWLTPLLAFMRLASWMETEGKARRDIRFHYDRSNRFYERFLDRRMVYSCAYFGDPSWTLEQAQVAKLDHICRKLDLQPGDTFLDVGCGWGALVVHAAECYGASAVGCTLSAEQLAFGRQAVRDRHLQHRVAIEDLDYRLVPGRFDKIASVGMYEHVGRRRLAAYFKALADRLAPDGRLLNHGIARPQHVSDDSSTVFLRRHVFPGGELPHLTDVIRAAESAGLEVLDVENLRPHYALTCAAWVARLQAQRERCLQEVGAATYRTWQLYLAAAAVGFERGETDIYQTLLAKRTHRGRRRLTRAHSAGSNNVLDRIR
jgi:cyclopropane-fatty-acyl-phospholipid synthase